MTLSGTYLDCVLDNDADHFLERNLVIVSQQHDTGKHSCYLPFQSLTRRFSSAAADLENLKQTEARLKVTDDATKAVYCYIEFVCLT